MARGVPYSYDPKSFSLKYFAAEFIREFMFHICPIKKRGGPPEHGAHLLLHNLSRELTTVKRRSEERARKLAKSRQVRLALVRRQSILVGQLKEQEKARHKTAASRRRAHAVERVLRVSRTIEYSSCEDAAVVAVNHALNVHSAGEISAIDDPGNCVTSFSAGAVCDKNVDSGPFVRFVVDISLVLATESTLWP